MDSNSRFIQGYAAKLPSQWANSAASFGLLPLLVARCSQAIQGVYLMNQHLILISYHLLPSRPLNLLVRCCRIFESVCKVLCF